MTINQEDALFDFLENVTEPFTLDDICAFMRMIELRKNSRLPAEITSFLKNRHIALPFSEKKWISRRGAFERVRFVISPARMEIANGILIPGHRCIPFANPVLFPHEYTFRWKERDIEYTTSESHPEDFYPFYSLFGEEYAAQYVARDNPENEKAFNNDPYDDPPEISIHTLDMRNIYRESAFVPGDRFVASTINWKEGIFELERVPAQSWSKENIDEWVQAAEEGFKKSFEYLGPGASTEEQIAHAYWFGGERMRSVPSLSLDDFLYEVTENIETVPYGIETRFWYAGKEIPDRKDLEGLLFQPDKTDIEEILFKRGVPVSEYVVQSFVRDALYRGEQDMQTNELLDTIIDRIIPQAAGLQGRDREYLAEYILELLNEFGKSYSRFADNAMGETRQRVAELHTAVVELALKLQKSEMDPSWLPKHTFIVLSQIQGHAASILEDLDVSESPFQTDLEAMDNSAESMLETYEDIRDLINEAMDNFRKNNFGLWQKTDKKETPSWRVAQISLGGTNIWRRLVLPDACTMTHLANIIRAIFDWDDEPIKMIVQAKTIGELCKKGISEFICETDKKWTVKVMILSWYQAKAGEQLCCVAGEGASPPRHIDGPLKFRRFVADMEKSGELRLVKNDQYNNFDPEDFDIDLCNKAIELINRE